MRVQFPSYTPFKFMYNGCMNPFRINPSRAYFIALQTSGTGSTWVSLPSDTAGAVEIDNCTNEVIAVKRTGSDVYWKLQPFTSRYFDGLLNANELSFKRLDSSNVQVTLQAEVRVF